ncbi:putative extensin [Iris pallida]|uniref:Extensin n=1 Tax=Iris pallida TaxID=29817 RepID=A0AAX6H6G6_IRIPA|nr:putative extensin [Iris pallida]
MSCMTPRTRRQHHKTTRLLLLHLSSQPPRPRQQPNPGQTSPKHATTIIITTTTKIDLRPLEHPPPPRHAIHFTTDITTITITILLFLPCTPDTITK